MELIKQPSFETCGQACIAMIAGKDINDVIKDMKTSGPTSIGQLMEKSHHFLKFMKTNTNAEWIFMVSGSISLSCQYNRSGTCG